MPSEDKRKQGKYYAFSVENLYKAKTRCECSNPLVYRDEDGDPSCYHCGHPPP
jgi:hypothetical protein